MNFDNIVRIGNYVHTSVSRKDYHAIDFLQKTGNGFVSVQCAYRTESAAQNALKQLKKYGDIPTPDYKIERYICEVVLCHTK